MIKEGGGGHTVFLDLALEVKHCHLHHVLFIRSESLNPSTLKGGRIRLHFLKQGVSKNLETYFKTTTLPSLIEYIYCSHNLLLTNLFTSLFLLAFQWYLTDLKIKTQCLWCYLMWPVLSPYKPLQCCLLFFPSSLSTGHILLLSVPLICQIPFDSGPLHMLFLEPRMIIILLHLFIIQFLVQRILPEESFSDSLAFISYSATVLVIACTFHLWG